jgi:hypothetical protein
MNRRIGRIGQLLAPSYGFCKKCKTPWRFVREHTTSYGTRGRGCFPLCQKCWDELTPQTRLPFYRALVMSWKHFDEPVEQTWAQLQEAVLAGG